MKRFSYPKSQGLAFLKAWKSSQEVALYDICSINHLSKSVPGQQGSTTRWCSEHKLTLRSLHNRSATKHLENWKTRANKKSSGDLRCPCGHPSPQHTPPPACRRPQLQKAFGSPWHKGATTCDFIPGVNPPILQAEGDRAYGDGNLNS